ncbi:LysM peptidoglycan-binding domain-containing M23 family metallopeptidase [Francisellaceae bacterium]|nr:LysM peptidoglycan-binding domain-containing M23 family metallopeptidase [Francisellaceae bacterium]
MNKKIVKICKSSLVVGLLISLCGCASISGWMSKKRTNAPANIKTIPHKVEYYRVKSGDTINSISHQFNVTERALVLWNSLSKPYALHAGEVIHLMPPKLASTEHSSGGVNTAALNTGVSKPYEPKSKQNSQAKPGALKFIVKKEAPTKHEIIQRPGKQAVRKPLESYVVKSGDTLLNIAHIHQMTLTEVSRINGLRAPYNIFIGQKLEVYKVKKIVKDINETSSVEVKVKKPIVIKQAPVSEKGKTISKGHKVNIKSSVEKTVVKKPELKIKPADIKALSSKSLNVGKGQAGWQAPLKSGMNFVKVGENGEALFKATAGENVYASQDGEVLYAGVGTRGYGEMVIVSHRSGYLTAYRNLESTSVSEGQVLVRGEEVGEVGAYHGESDLGFEVRKDGVIIPAKNLWK